MASEDDIRRAIDVLEAMLEEPDALTRLGPEERRRLLEAAGRLSRPTFDEKRQRARSFRRKDRRAALEHDAQVLSAADLRRQKTLSAFLPEAIHRLLDLPEAPREPVAPDESARLENPRACYVCKAAYDRVHAFYHSMCPACAELNFEKREQTARLEGRVALVTGSRIKIGYHTVLKLLRAGAYVIATTRFPVDAARRYAAEPDYAAWHDRLRIYGIDLRHTPSVEQLAADLSRELDRLDILVNNAAQTVRRPPAFYRHLLDAERAPVAALPGEVARLLGETEARRNDALDRAQAEERGASAMLAAMPWAGEIEPDPALFPEGQRDGDEQQIDLRATNSWRQQMADVATPELLEVHLVNAIAPFVLTSRLKALMMRDRTDEKHVIHVSAMEASFSRRKKTINHPHTNMAKAALNMMTRTSAADYARDGIFMNSVDTGWVTDEDPLHHAARKQRVHDFHAPLDSIDGAARVLDPLFVGLRTGEHPWGLFLKDYRPTSW